MKNSFDPLPVLSVWKSWMMQGELLRIKANDFGQKKTTLEFSKRSQERLLHLKGKCTKNKCKLSLEFIEVIMYHLLPFFREELLSSRL